MHKSLMTLLMMVLLATPALAVDFTPGETPQTASNVVPRELKGVGVTERRGKKLNLDLQFTNSHGQAVKLGQYFNHGHPVVMAMVYYSCPNLCNLQMNGLVDMFKKMKGEAGKFYEVVFVSMYPKETAELAAQKKANYMKELGQPGADKYWHFLVGTPASVTELSNELGYHYRWNSDIKQFAHVSATYIVTPEGVLSRYLYGIEFQPETVRLSLVEASHGKIGTVVDQIALCCFQFSPTGGKYVLWSFNLMRIACVFTVILLSIVLIPVWIHERKRRLASRTASVSAGS